jgi:hypothetical protein
MKFFLSRRALIQATILGVLANFRSANSGSAALPISIKNTQISINSIQINVLSTTDLKAYLEYGFQKSKYSKKSSIVTLAKGQVKSLVISDLSPDSTVFFRVRYALIGRSTFLALPAIQAKTNSFVSNSVFAIQADPHMDENSSADVYNGTLAQIVAASPAFLMDLGDIFMVDKLSDKSEKNIRARFVLMKDFYKKLGSIPLKICLGNHDGELGYSKFNTKNYRKEYFPDETYDLAYYSFTGPDQLHVVLDPFTYTTKNPTSAGWEWTLGNTQYDWLVDTLTNSTATHKFVYIHHLLVGDAQSRGGVEIAKYNEWGGLNKDGSNGFAINRPGWDKPIHQLLLDTKVGFVFKGHDHLYVKQELDGIIYQTVPQPSHPGEKLDVKQYGYLSGKGVGGSGFIKVSTEGKVAKIDFIKFDGSIGDSYTRSA